MASFKVPCPSCEHQVPIKSDTAIGSKVECPKCKYRFKVEAPADGVPKESGKKEAGKSDKKKTTETTADKKKSKKTVAIIVGVLAVAILAAVGFAFMGGDKKKSNTGPVSNQPRPNLGSGGTGGTDVGTGTGGADEGKGETDGKDKDKGPKKVKRPSSIPYSTMEASNLLPNQTVAVCRLDAERLRQTPAGILFDSTMQQMLLASIGVTVDQVEVYYHAYVGDKREPFGVIKLGMPVLEKDLVAKISGAEKPKQIKSKWSLYRFRSNPLINGVSSAFGFASLFGDLYEKLPPKYELKANSTPRSFGLCVYDQQHIFVGEYGQLESFLSSLSEKGDPKYLSDTTAAPGVTLTDSRFYLSINPKLKSIMRELGGESQTPPMMVCAEQYSQGSYDPKSFKADFQPISVVIDPVLNRTEYIGGCLTLFSNRQVLATAQLVMKSDAAAFEVVRDQVSPGLTT
ncbi:MAG TPA: IBR domain-containing protein, partial [Gemmata sp.]|nr:IBR domain-containing protein [Gemmata sp.]